MSNTNSDNAASDIFRKLSRNPRDVSAPEGSINAELLALPQQRIDVHDMQGRVLLFPRNGIIGVPFRLMRSDGYAVVVVNGSAYRDPGTGAEVYPRGGYHIVVSDLEMQTAIELDIKQ